MNHRKRKRMSNKKWNGLLVGAFKRPNKWRLEKPLTFHAAALLDSEIAKLKECKVDIKITSSGKITVPLGYVTDLASVPRACWAFIAPFDVARPAVIHDIMYERINARRGEISASDLEACRKIADCVFLQAMGETEPLVASWKKYAAYYAVRLFGRFAIKSSAPRTWES